MITLEEAIRRQKELEKFAANEYFTFNIEKRKQDSVEHKQVAEWLEELKANKDTSVSVYEQGYMRGYANGYAKAIDEFVKLANECSGYTSDCIEHNLSLTVYTIHQIAEQMKGGAECLKTQ